MEKKDEKENISPRPGFEPGLFQQKV